MRPHPWPCIDARKTDYAAGAVAIVLGALLVGIAFPGREGEGELLQRSRQEDAGERQHQ